jgi:deferrochelatase/peroxidase EfeB
MQWRSADSSDIQAIVWTGFGSLDGASYLLLRVVEPRSARQWLRTLTPTSIADLGADGTKKNVDEGIQIAFTAPGLRALGLDDAIVQRFSPEFVEGMASDENRSRRLGDTGANTPANWDWGVENKAPHILLILLASAQRIKALVSRVQDQAEAAGLSAIATLPTSDMGDIEPFGFVDGISQPSFDWDGIRTPGTRADRDYTNLLALGELLLGYRNEYGLLTERPLLFAGERNAAFLPKASHPRDSHDLGRNGTYLVYRQLAQDVRGFWRWVAAEASRCGVAMDSLAESMIGRRLDGSPLADLELLRSIPGVDARDWDLNGFRFDTDPDGLSCPLGAHIRRANPRSGDAPGGRNGLIDDLLVTIGLTTRRTRRATSSTFPWPLNTTVWPFVRSEDDAIASARFHRILRRGREYGLKIDRHAAVDPATPDPQAGLHFLCLNANIARQFEFVQTAWIASAKFAGLTGEQDPLLGNREPFPTVPITNSPLRNSSWRRLFLLARISRAQVDRQRLRRPRRSRSRSARCALPNSFSGGSSQAHRTCACGPGFDCRAADDPASNARD